MVDCGVMDCTMVDCGVMDHGMLDSSPDFPHDSSHMQ